MKNAIIKLCCRKSLLLALTLLCGAGQGYGQPSKLMVSSLGKVMSQQHLDKSLKDPSLIKFGIFPIIGGGGILLALTGNMAQYPLITGAAGVLAVCGVAFCATKATKEIIRLGIRLVDRKVKLNPNNDDIVIYASDGGGYQLGHVVGEGNNSSSIKVVSADGMQDIIKTKQVKQVLDLANAPIKNSELQLLDYDLTNDHSQMLVKRTNRELHSLDYLGEASDGFLENAVIAFKHEGKNYLKTFSKIENTDDGEVELTISGEGRIVISVDSEGIAVLDGDLHGDLSQAMIFLP